MTELQMRARINELERARCRWKRFAFGALAALVLVLFVGGVTAVFQRQQIRAEQQRAQQAIQEVEDLREQARRNLYYSRLALAEREWAANVQPKAEDP